MEEMLESENTDSQRDEAHTELIPYSFAKRYGLIVRADSPDRVYHRPDTPFTAMGELRRYLKRPLVFESLSTENFEHQLQQAYEHRGGAAGQIVTDIGDELDLSVVAQQLPESEDLLESEDDAPIIRLINALYSQAIKEGASDIHIEPYETSLIVRLRVDGILREVLETDRKLAPLVVSRIKVMSRLDIAEKRLPQDGRVSVKIAGRAVDVRVSTLPSSHGERVVMRLLDRQAQTLDCESLGMKGTDRNRFMKVISQPHGIVLVTGPTGSGKTTTLYAALSKLNESRRNIMTVEDPIEYDLRGISQSQVNERAGLDFARGLRAILRQDPDIVMVGEIRDLETAEIAVQASLTGHLVLSTLHTNTAIGAIARLRDMGVEPFLLASSLTAVVAQRLVRRICKNCGETYLADDAEKQTLGVTGSEELHLYRAVGCSKCNHTGYIGREGIYEVITLNDELKELIHENANEARMLEVARKDSPAMLDDGITKVLAGDTSLDELIRVTQQTT